MSLPFARCIVAAILLAAGAASTTPLAAATPAELERRIAELEAAYEARLRTLEARIAELEAAQGQAAGKAEVPAAPPADDLAALLAAADAAAEGVAPTPTPAAPGGEPEAGKERNLNALNPEISFTGDVVALSEGGENDFEGREFELDFQSALDPFSFTKWTLSFSPEEGVDIEEGYIAYRALAPGLSVRAGKMRQSFGVLNRWHLHALPQPDYPLALQSYFGEEGLAQTGVSVEWLLPRPWADANELVVQLTDGSAEPFGGESFDDLSALVHLKNYWDLTTSTYLEWGLSGVLGTPDGLEATRVFGSDLTWHWQPPERAKYRELTWRTEVLLSQRDTGFGERRDAWGGYSYFEGLLTRNWYLGARADWLEDPLDAAAEVWAVEPYVSWWQSEYVRLRAAYRLLHDGRDDDDRGRFLFQVTWAAGPHKHETY